VEVAARELIGVESMGLGLLISGFLQVRKRKKEEGRREGQARSACTRYATSTDSPRRLVLGTYGLALSTIFQGMQLSSTSSLYKRPPLQPHL
jgi:hypothetical protein